MIGIREGVYLCDNCRRSLTAQDIGFIHYYTVLTQTGGAHHFVAVTTEPMTKTICGRDIGREEKR